MMAALGCRTRCVAGGRLAVGEAMRVGNKRSHGKYHDRLLPPSKHFPTLSDDLHHVQAATGLLAADWIDKSLRARVHSEISIGVRTNHDHSSHLENCVR